MLLGTNQSPKKINLLILLTGGDHWIGGIQYTNNILRALSLLDHKNILKVSLRANFKNRPFIKKYFQKEYSFVKVSYDFNFFYRAFLALFYSRFKVLSPFFLKLYYLFKFPTVAFPVKSNKISGFFEKIFWIPDFQYKYYPEFFSKLEIEERNLMYSKFISKDSILVLSSKAAQLDLIKFFPECKCKVKILKFTSFFLKNEYAADPHEVLTKYNLPLDYAYIPNQFWQHKGHDLVFAALKILKNKGILINLVCTGSPNDYRSQDYYKKMHNYCLQQNLIDRIYFLGVIPRADQIQVYRCSSFVIQPSRFEGWNTSVEDARALGKTILLSDIDVHKEQNPPQALYFKNGDYKDLSVKLRYLWQNKEVGCNYSKELNAKIKSYKRAFKFAETFISIINLGHKKFIKNNFS